MKYKLCSKKDDSHEAINVYEADTLQEAVSFFAVKKMLPPDLLLSIYDVVECHE